MMALCSSLCSVLTFVAFTCPLLCYAVLNRAVQLQGYLSQPRTISSHHFGSGLLKGEVLPANSRLVSSKHAVC